MNNKTNHLYEFGSFRLDQQERLLQRDGATISLTPKAFDLLLALVARHGRLVEKEELFKTVWSDTVVEESNLSSNVALIRKALGDGENGLKFIETVPKRGYRFVAAVLELAPVSAIALQSESVDSLNKAPSQAVTPVGQSRTPSKRRRTAIVALGGIVIAAIGAWFYFNRPFVLTDKDTILLADFTNTTGDSEFDGLLKTGLAVHLGQSPFLNLFADDRVHEMLRLMNRSPDERVTPAIGREICQRQGLKALLTGSIASLGRNYVISLEAINAQTGEVLAREQGEAEGQEQVLRTLGKAADQMREKLGESLSSIQKFSAPLEQATTPSLEAFNAFCLGREQVARGKPFEAIPSLKHAIELDPNFARAHIMLAVAYDHSGQWGLAAGAAQKAFQLRERVSAREKYEITGLYHWIATGGVNESIEAMELWKQTYPRDYVARSNRGNRYTQIGQYEKAVEELRESICLNPNFGPPYRHLATALMRLNRFDEAKAIGEQAIAQRLAGVVVRGSLYHIAFIQEDTAAMRQQVDWASGQPSEYVHLNWQAGAAAFGGQWQKARLLSNHAAELAEQRKLREVAGDIASSNAELAAVLKLSRQSRADLAYAATFPRTPTSFFRASMAQAFCGEAAQVQKLSDEAVKRYPENTLVNEVYLPMIRAALELQHGNFKQSIQILHSVSHYESVSNLYQNYILGQAYLGELNGAEAAREFQTILDHRGLGPTSPLYPLAHLGLARAAVLQGDTAKARKSYQDFLILWKDADADLPALNEAKHEYALLK